MDVHEYPWIYMGIDGYPWISMGIQGGAEHHFGGSLGLFKDHFGATGDHQRSFWVNLSGLSGQVDFPEIPNQGNCNKQIQMVELDANVRNPSANAHGDFRPYCFPTPPMQHK